MKTTASCFGSESTADAVKIQKFIPHVENTAVRTVTPPPPPPAAQVQGSLLPLRRASDCGWDVNRRRTVAGDEREAHEEGHPEPAPPHDLGEERPVQLALLELPAARVAPPLVHAVVSPRRRMTITITITIT